MDLATLVSVAQTLFAALQCTELKEMWSMMGYKSELDDLSRTVTTVRAVLLDAESKQDDLSHETQVWVKELKAAVYDADDLLDEFVTLAKQKKLIHGGKLSTEVRLFFSRFNPLSVAYNMSQGVKKIKKQLDEIAKNHTKFGLSLDYKPAVVDNKLIRNRREETCSYVNSTDIIIGRADDVESIVGTLLGSTGNCDVSFLGIVGMGGLGKTALAQLIYNDAKVAREFPLRLWTCVSDQDQTKFDVKTILSQILESDTRQKPSSMEVLSSNMKEKLAGKRFLIVLDDVWTENRHEWRKLAGYLMGGKKGSWVIVTTRSKETATIVGDNHVYELKGLSDENSWHLFKQVAFEQVVDRANSNPHVDLINIGQKIVKYCANVPLAIKVVGSLLYGRDKNKWLSVQEFGLANLREDENGIRPILKLSYRNLESPLKNCFSYCTLFPKDYKIKELLISLWIAQGFVVPLEKGQSIEDAGEEYFLILLRRCFFQDVDRDTYGEIYSFKLHDLMHDVAVEVTVNEICGASSLTGDMDNTIRHVSAWGDALVSDLCMTKAHIRTCFHLGSCYSDVIPNCIGLLLENNRYLRALNLCFRNIQMLPDSLGKLIHLRYLHISLRKIESLPKSITKLYNLQTLDLSDCVELKELPRDLSKLVSLRVLKLPRFSKLTYMPSGMGKLNGLYNLNEFVIGEGNSSPKQRVDLEGLKMLKNLRGTIKIVIFFPQSGAFVKCDSVKDGAYMRDKEHLNGITFECKHEESYGHTSYEEEVLRALQPHANLKELDLVGYHSVTMPRWADHDNLATFLPNLVRLCIGICSELEYLPSLTKLKHLKSLCVMNLPKLEYIENNREPTSLLVSNGEELSLLPCLEEIDFSRLPKLKSWWMRSGKGLSENSISRSNEIHTSSSFSFFRLKKLKIYECPEFTALPSCPNVEELRLCKFNRKLRIITSTALEEEIGEVSLFTSSPTSCPKLRKARTDNLAGLYSSVPMEAFQSLIFMQLSGDEEVESLTEYKQMFDACSSSLQTLGISDCQKLRSISGGLQCLARLERLFLEQIPIERLAEENKGGGEEGEGMPWGSLSHTLNSLNVWECEELKTIPRWIRNFSVLSDLGLVNCSEELHERCQSPNGEDWSNIQHIPTLAIWR